MRLGFTGAALLICATSALAGPRTLVLLRTTQPAADDDALAQAVTIYTRDRFSACTSSPSSAPSGGSSDRRPISRDLVQTTFIEAIRSFPRFRCASAAAHVATNRLGTAGGIRAQRNEYQ